MFVKVNKNLPLRGSPDACSIINDYTYLLLNVKELSKNQIRCPIVSIASVIKKLSHETVTLILVLL